MNSVEKSEIIAKFKEIIDYKGKEGSNIELYVEAYNNDKMIYQHLTICRIYEDYSYGQESIDIYFDRNDSNYQRYSLRMSYNTHFNDFELKDNKLYILDKNNSIVVVMWRL